MNEACSTYGGEERCVQGNLRERDHFFRKWDVGAWTALIWLRDTHKWWALVNAVMNVWVP
jgi:hypothetical protein